VSVATASSSDSDGESTESPVFDDSQLVASSTNSNSNISSFFSSPSNNSSSSAAASCSCTSFLALILQEMLRHYVYNHHEQWVTRLPYAEFAINNSISASTGHMSINRLMQVNVEAPSEHACSSSTVESINMCSTNRSALQYKV
jgi:hypothetical protein